ncbi:39S ribosomal protein L35, mitochondrial [Uranotaenia lowii]|uniref:39S ribosomal protein L35, mitochondrial n=1 Tax=Uranotaenia lowii TaxID=190385 RepID=UPI002479A6D8|nr:39S ribosomal protein L35, mitochondrial [Uranotaenia lowii]
MLRPLVSAALRNVNHSRALVRPMLVKPATNMSNLNRDFSTMLRISNSSIQRVPFTVCAQAANAVASPTGSILTALSAVQQQPSRTVIKFSLGKGKRKTVKAVVKRFKRLHWGGWIRTMSGRHKHMWRKSAARKHRLKQHVLVNSQQATLLDKMVTKYWKRPRFYINDPYAPYHTREELRETRRKPLKY